METAQDALTNLGLSLSQAPLVQLAPGQTVAPVQTLQAAVRDALQCQVSQLAFADKVWTGAHYMYCSTSQSVLCEHASSL